MDLQTLCYKCHKKKSADEAARRAKMRKDESK
jgi:5-methylcytosine-specific restriction endonuclease McrA